MEEAGGIFLSTISQRRRGTTTTAVHSLKRAFGTSMSICQERGGCCWLRRVENAHLPARRSSGVLSLWRARARTARRGAVAKRTSGHRLRSLIHLLTQPAARYLLCSLRLLHGGHEQLLYPVVNRPRKLPAEVGASGLLLLSCGARSELLREGRT